MSSSASCANPQCPNKSKSGSVELLRCSRCKSVHYCCAECQKSHWKAHKSVCKPEAAPAVTSSKTSDGVDVCIAALTQTAKFCSKSSVPIGGIKSEYDLRRAVMCLPICGYIHVESRGHYLLSSPSCYEQYKSKESQYEYVAGLYYPSSVKINDILSTMFKDVSTLNTVLQRGDDDGMLSRLIGLYALSNVINYDTLIRNMFKWSGWTNIAVPMISRGGVAPAPEFLNEIAAERDSFVSLSASGFDASLDLPSDSRVRSLLQLAPLLTKEEYRKFENLNVLIEQLNKENQALVDSCRNTVYSTETLTPEVARAMYMSVCRRVCHSAPMAYSSVLMGNDDNCLIYTMEFMDTLASYVKERALLHGTPVVQLDAGMGVLTGGLKSRGVSIQACTQQPSKSSDFIHHVLGHHTSDVVIGNVSYESTAEIMVRVKPAILLLGECTDVNEYVNNVNVKEIIVIGTASSSSRLTVPAGWRLQVLTEPSRHCVNVCDGYTPTACVISMRKC